MKFWKKMQNPFVLVGQGFVLGAVLFFASHPASIEAAVASASPAAASSQALR